MGSADEQERLPIEQIAQKYQGEWVLLDEPTVDQSGTVVEGSVLAHSPSADVIYEAAAVMARPRTAILSFAPIPEGTVFVL